MEHERRSPSSQTSSPTCVECTYDSSMDRLRVMEDGTTSSEDRVDPTLRLALLEQVMRLSGDEFYAILVAEAVNNKALRSAIGQLIGSAPTPMPLGSPLLALSGLCPIAQEWRKACPARPESLWAQLEFYRSLGYCSETDDPLAELFAARDVASAEIDVPNDL